ncbi:transmembrane protein 71 [Anabas testudineus]|uniref:Transmembrane protein 71 n=1 Tax=Anabas testudineus TaxID=64144 RepID=A0A3Q1IPZ6_ANATE|nr:transmembrane protein 71 [Anabas testudineus]
MALFFSGAVTSSPIKRKLRGNQSSQSLDVSLLSPDSSYVCSSVDGGDPCCCRRSPRLLTNGYYSVTEDSFTWDDDGNVSLSPCKTNVSYKENLVRVFRRRRRPRNSLARLLSNVTESCQSWLDENVFRGMFGTGQNQSQHQEQVKDVDREYDQEQDWAKSRQQGPTLLDESSWFGSSNTELEDSRSFTYDPTEIPPPPDKEAPAPKLLIQEEICSEICQSKEQFTQSLGGLSEVPPPSYFYTNTCCCQVSPEHTGLTLKTFLLFLFTIFVVTVLYSGCLWWSTTVTTTVFMMMTTFMFLTKSGPMGEWRRAKTEDITSRNE